MSFPLSAKTFARLKWPIVVLVLGIAFEIFSCASFLRLFSNSGTTFIGPGEVSVNISKPGDYTLWYETETSIDGEYRRFADTLPSGVSIRVSRKSDGVTVPARPSLGSSTYSNGVRRVSVAQVLLDHPGEYLISVNGLHEKRSFYLDHTVYFRTFLYLLGAGMIGTLLIIVAVLWAIWMMTRAPRPHGSPSSP